MASESPQRGTCSRRASDRPHLLERSTTLVGSDGWAGVTDLSKPVSCDATVANCGLPYGWELLSSGRRQQTPDVPPLGGCDAYHRHLGCGQLPHVVTDWQAKLVVYSGVACGGDAGHFLLSAMAAAVPGGES